MFKTFLSALVASAVTAIDYSSHGASWSSDYYCLHGDRQSPINIDKASAVKSDAVSFKLVNYHDITNATMSLTHDSTVMHINNPNIQKSLLDVRNELGHE